jgi:hypothetical protein
MKLSHTLQFPVPIDIFSLLMTKKRDHVMKSSDQKTLNCVGAQKVGIPPQALFISLIMERALSGCI